GDDPAPGSRGFVLLSPFLFWSADGGWQGETGAEALSTRARAGAVAAPQRARQSRRHRLLAEALGREADSHRAELGRLARAGRVGLLRLRDACARAVQSDGHALLHTA